MTLNDHDYDLVDLGDDDLDLDERDVAPAVPLPTLKDDQLKLRELRQEDLRLGKEAKAAHAAYIAKRTQVWDRMAEEGQESTAYKGVAKFSQNEIAWKPAIQDKRKLLAWAREEMPSLLETAYAKRLLNQLVRERMRDGRELPPGLGAYPEKIVSIRKA